MGVLDNFYTKALLHFNGADASTTFTDESGKVWTAAGNAQIDTAQSKFGGASGLFDGTGDYIDTPDHADFDVGSGNFTVDFWVRPAAINQNAILFGQSDAALTAASRAIEVWLYDTEGIAAFIFYGSSNKTAAIAAGYYAANTWYHIALVRNGNVLTLYGNGIAGATMGDMTGITVNNATSVFSIGRCGLRDLYYLNGWIDEFRFSKGIARWTANFTPPIGEYYPVGGQMSVSPFMVFMEQWKWQKKGWLLQGI